MIPNIFSFLWGLSNGIVFSRFRSGPQTPLIPLESLGQNLKFFKFPENFSSVRRIDFYRPFYAVRIAKTNLILLLVDTWRETCTSKLSVEQETIIYDAQLADDRDVPACNKKMINSYPRKKLRGCGDKILQVNLLDLISLFWVWLRAYPETHFEARGNSNLGA